jgi:ADP-heptose:LPS heptosyltransferase
VYKRQVKYGPDVRILITGASHESERCREIEKGIGKNVINTAGQFDLDNVVALVQKANLIVCSNTGMLHIASCVGTKTMGLHGPTNPEKWGSYSKNAVLIQSDKFCSPCLYLGHDYGCQVPQCMAHISVDDVFIYIRKSLNPELFNISHN